MESVKDLAIVIAWPEIPTRGDERWMKFLKKTGLVKNLHFKVGHAAIVLVNHRNGDLAYYDFGRYVAPLGCGRARSAQSDPRLALISKARTQGEGDIANIREVVDEMHANREATHGAGIMYFSIADSLSFERASAYADKLVSQGPIKYGAIAADCNSCSRFVAQVLLAGWSPRHASRSLLLLPESFKPSPMSNVVNARLDRMVYAFDGYSLSRQRISRLKSFVYQARLIGESLSRSKASDFPSDQTRGHVARPIRAPSIPAAAQWLGGIGEGAWYAIEPIGDNARQFNVTRYDAAGSVIYTARYKSETDCQTDGYHQLTFHTEYRFVTVRHRGVTIRLSLMQQDTEHNNHAFAI